MSQAHQPYDPAVPPQHPPDYEPRKSRGCLYGCLSIAGAAVALTLCAGIGGYWLVTSQVKKYTSETPVDLPVVEYTEEQIDSLETRIENFTDAMDAGQTPDQDLELTAEEINALIGNDEDLRGRVFVRIANGEVSGDVSIPADFVPGGKGRYFNGSATVDVSMEGGVLIVTLVDADVNGKKLPDEITDALANENLAKEVYKNKEHAEVLRKFEKISVEGDKILLKVRRPEETQ